MSKIVLAFVAITLVVATLAAPCPAQDVAGGVALEPYRSVHFDAFEVGTRWNYRVWDRKYLVAWTHESSATSASVALYDAEGNLVREVIVWLADSTKVQINSVAVTVSDLLVVAGAAANADRSVAYFLATFDQSGEIKDVIRTNPFVPLRVCTTDNGDLWAYGWDKEGGAYNMLRRFSSSKGEMNGVLNRTSVPRKIQVTRNDIFLRCAGTRIYLYMGPTEELVRFDTVTNELLRSRWKSTPERADVTGFAVNDAGEMLASFADRHLPKGKRAGIFLFKQTIAGEGRWTPAQGMDLATRSDPKPFDLLGSQGNDIVYLATTPPLRATVNWARPKPQPKP